LSSAIAGGDFRFQGQWLESDSGLYYFRARDYDAKTGLFLSRDAMEPDESAPENANPYQFAYHNPNIYSDPSGMITISEINAADVVDRELEKIYQREYANVGRRVINEAKGVASNVFQSTINKINPFANFAVPVSFNKSRQGIVFEEVIMKVAFCEVLASVFPQFLNYVHFEVGVNPNGIPQNDGRFQCTANGLVNFLNIVRSSNYNHPDFVIKQGGPQSTDNSPPAFLIGDFKRQVTTVNPYGNQWKAILNYAKSSTLQGGHQIIPIALYITLYGSDQENRSKEAFLKKKAATDFGVALQIISFL
jgi:RHS repeat-associated protein